VLKFCLGSAGVILCIYYTCVNELYAMNEFELIKNLKSRYGLGSVGDDCAVLPNGSGVDLLMTADLLIEGIDFELSWSTAKFIGHKALAVSLSDIAAMGGSPKWAMLTLGIPEALWTGGFIDDFYEGWHALATAASVELIGGDISRSPDKLVVDSIVCGQVEHGRAVLRSGARIDDEIFVSGPLGGAAAGLAVLLKGSRQNAEISSVQQNLTLKQLKPSPQLRLANLLQTRNIATAMIDLSDGLSSDLHHLVEASQVGAEINIESVPICDRLEENFDLETVRDLVLNGGEDFELLFTCSPENGPAARELGCVKIGRITAKKGVVSANGSIEPRGFRHF
jgi:thiamine-monophosphate kinase